MNWRLRKPELIPTLAMLVVLAFTMGLCVWQVERLQWKTALLAQIDAAQSQAPQDISSIPISNLKDYEWHNVLVTGTLLNDKELLATPRYLNGQLGYAVLTPLKVKTATGDIYLLINRGWVPPGKKESSARAGGNPREPVTIAGVIRTSFTHGRFVPDNRPDKNLWFWYDLPEMAKALGLPLLPVLIDETQGSLATSKPIADAPIPFPIEINIRNDHLGYAITWFLIGLSDLIVYLVYYLERKSKP